MIRKLMLGKTSVLQTNAFFVYALFLNAFGLCAFVLVIISVLPSATYSQEAAQEKEQLHTNRIIGQLQQGRPAIGTFTRSARDDLDFVVIDEQYGEFDINGVREALTAMQKVDGISLAAPVIRIPLAAKEAPQAVVMQVLEAGALGVMFPDIETKQQAMAAISSMQYSQTRVWPLEPSGKLLAMIQIESLTGIANLSEILQVPGIGVIFLGPTDLAISTGENGPNSPKIEALVQQVLKVCLAKNIPCGYPIVATTRADAERETARRLEEGFKVLAVMAREL